MVKCFCFILAKLLATKSRIFFTECYIIHVYTFAFIYISLSCFDPKMQSSDPNKNNNTYSSMVWASPQTQKALQLPFCLFDHLPA